jgi:hypothetical protein
MYLELILELNLDALSVGFDVVSVSEGEEVVGLLLLLNGILLMLQGLVLLLLVIEVQELLLHWLLQSILLLFVSYDLRLDEVKKVFLLRHLGVAVEFLLIISFLHLLQMNLQNFLVAQLIVQEHSLAKLEVRRG